MPLLPTEINVQIFARLDCQSLINLSETCSAFRRTILEHNLFKAVATSTCPWLIRPLLNNSSWEATVRSLASKPLDTFKEISSYDTNEILKSCQSVQFSADLEIAFEHDDPVDMDGVVMFETQRSQLDSEMFRVSPEEGGYIYSSPSMSSNAETPWVARVNCQTLKAEQVMKRYLIGDPELVEKEKFMDYTGQIFQVPDGEFCHQTVADGKFYGILRRNGLVYLFREGCDLVKLPFGGRKMVDIRLHMVQGHAFFTATNLISLRPQATMLYVVGRDSNTVCPLFDCHPYDIPHNFAVHGEYLYLCKDTSLFQIYCDVVNNRTYIRRVINNPVHYAASKIYTFDKYLLVKSFAGSQVLFDLDSDSMSKIIHDRDVNLFVRYEDELVCFCFSKPFLARLREQGQNHLNI